MYLFSTLSPLTFVFLHADPGAPPQSQEGGQEAWAQEAQEGPQRARCGAVQGGAPAGSRAEEAEGKMQLVGTGRELAPFPSFLEEPRALPVCACAHPEVRLGWALSRPSRRASFLYSPLYTPHGKLLFEFLTTVFITVYKHAGSGISTVIGVASDGKIRRSPIQMQ